jgi:hypothetical protein
MGAALARHGMCKLAFNGLDGNIEKQNVFKLQRRIPFRCD